MINNISQISEILPMIKIINGLGKKIVVISELKTGNIFGIFDSTSFSPSEGMSKQFQISGVKVDEIMLRLKNVVNSHSQFTLNYNKEVDASLSTKIWLSDNQFGYAWFIS